MTEPGRVALVTGANKGIGFEVARGLGRAGVAVYLAARQPALGERAAAELRDEGLDVRFLELDVTRPEHATAAAARVEAEAGRLDILVNNAGTGLDFTPPSRAPEAETRVTFETNLFGPIRLIQATLPLLRRSPAGRIVNVSSDFGSLALNCDPSLPHGRSISLAYPASKAALNQVTVQFAKELRGTGITINSVDPGFTDTDMVNDVGMRSRRPPARGAAAIVEIALAADGPHGAFLNAHGPVPW